MTRKTAIGVGAAAIFVSSVAVANWATSTFGFVPVGFGLSATAGTYAAGVALAARDAIQDVFGKKWMLAALAAAAVLSFVVADPHIAAASAIAFAVSELADFAVYTPLRRRARLGDPRWAGAVIASNLFGAVVDTVVFLAIAFGAAAVAPAMAGQLLGKSYATVAYLVIGKAVSLTTEKRVTA